MSTGRGRCVFAGSGWRRRVAAAAAFVVACASTPEPPTRAGGLAEAWERYEAFPAPKALAAAVDGDHWAYAIGAGETQKGAVLAALRDCEKHRAQYGVVPPCSLRAVDDAVVWSLDDALVEFPHYREHKALWVAGPPEAHLFGYAHGFPSQDEANRAALEQCRGKAAPWDLDHTCRLCVTGSGIPCTLLEPGWE